MWDFCLSFCFTSLPLPPRKIHLLKKSPVISLECGFWLCLTAKLFDVLPRLTFHQIPGLGVFFTSSQRPVRWICFVLLIWRVDGVCSFLASWWAVKLPESVCSCWWLYLRVPVYTQERTESCYAWKTRKLEKLLTPSYGDFHKDKVAFRGSSSLPPSWYWDSTLITPSSCLPCLISHTGVLSPSSQVQREPPVLMLYLMQALSSP